jgi:hypothetical protein
VNAPAVLALYDAGSFKDAYELLYESVKENYLSASMFLALAVTNFYANYPEAAERYAFQALKLQELLGEAAHTDLLKAYASAMHDAVAEWKASRIVVNGRQAHLYPTQHQLEQAGSVEKYIMAGYAPVAPMIAKSDRIVTVGSCFTGQVTRFLKHNGYDIPQLNTEYPGQLPTASFSDEVFNTYILRYLFELGFAEVDAEDDTYRAINQHNRSSNVSVAALRQTFAAANVFLMTLGLAEVWFNRQTGEVYNTAKSVGDYDPAVHDFRLTTVAENFANIEWVYRAIRARAPDAPIIFTLSPVPLRATFRPINCIAASTVSKATLRVALDELMRAHADDPRLFYFPSYELVTNVLPHPFAPDRRYIARDTVNTVMQMFANHFLVRDAA